jgi:hypothetical protein
LGLGFNPERFLKKLCAGTVAAGILFHLSTYLWSLGLGFFLFFFTPAGLDVARRVVPKVDLLFFKVLVPSPLPVGFVFLALWIVFILCFIVAWKGPGLSFPQAVKLSFSHPLTRSFKNYLYLFPILTSMLLVAENFIESIQEAHGVPTGGLEVANPYLLFFSASYAAVFEEIGFRLVPLGAVVAALVLWEGWRKFWQTSFPHRLWLLLLAFLYPEGVKKRVGLRNVEAYGWQKGIGRAEWLMVLASASVFALAHILSGSEWEVGKVSLTFILGLVFAAVYLIYGLAAAILVHWFHNYHLVLLWLGYQHFGQAFHSWATSANLAIFLFGLGGWATLTVYAFFQWTKEKTEATGQLPH